MLRLYPPHPVAGTPDQRRGTTGGAEYGRVAGRQHGAFAALHLPGALKGGAQAPSLIEPAGRADTSAALATKVLEHRLDCAFIAGPVVHPELQFDELVVEELVRGEAHAAPAVAVQPLIIFGKAAPAAARALAWRARSATPRRTWKWARSSSDVSGGVGVDLDAAPGGGAVIPRGRSGD